MAEAAGGVDRGDLGLGSRDVLGEEPRPGRCSTTVETETKYSGYIAQQERQIERLKNAERRPIPAEFGFHGDSGPVAGGPG